MNRILREFEDFIKRGNVIDLAVGIVIGGGFGKVVTSFVNDILMPPIGLLLGRVDFSDLFINLSHHDYEHLADAKKAGAATLNYGLFINSVIDFLIVAFVVFLVIRQINRLHGPTLPTEPTTKECPYCASFIPIKATRCPNCTSELR